jgi:hypothetical protein
VVDDNIWEQDIVSENIISEPEIFENLEVPWSIQESNEL